VTGLLHRGDPDAEDRKADSPAHSSPEIEQLDAALELAHNDPLHRLGKRRVDRRGNWIGVADRGRRDLDACGSEKLGEFVEDPPGARSVGVGIAHPVDPVKGGGDDQVDQSVGGTGSGSANREDAAGFELPVREDEGAGSANGGLGGSGGFHGVLQSGAGRQFSAARLPVLTVADFLAGWVRTISARSLKVRWPWR
jgi:hypothetical protein